MIQTMEKLSGIPVIDIKVNVFGKCEGSGLGSSRRGECPETRCHVAIVIIRTNHENCDAVIKQMRTKGIKC